MECYIHPAIDYLNVPSLLSKQRAFIVARLKHMSRKGEIFNAGNLFKNGTLRTCSDAPGIVEFGWTHSNIYKGQSERDVLNSQNKLNQNLKFILEKLRGSQHAWPFELPVDAEQVNKYIY